MSAVDKATDWAVARWSYLQKRITSTKRAPPYVVAEIEKMGLQFDGVLEDFSARQLQNLAMRIPWIHANLRRIANEVSSADLKVYNRETDAVTKDHQLRLLLEDPNPFFSLIQILQVTSWILHLDEWGAYWFLMPDDNMEDIVEIWPVPANRIQPVRGHPEFIKYYRYKVPGIRKPYKLPVENVVRFSFPHPDDIYKSLTPLEAARSSISLYKGIREAQSSLYTEGRGIPLSVVGVDPNVNPADFRRIRADIQSDWESGKRIAIARAGELSVGSIGISNRDLETVASEEFNRDEIDVLFMGLRWHADDQGDLREINRQIKEQTIRPLHLLLASSIHSQLTKRHFDENHTAAFDDVRNQDRSILIQERNVTWRVKTVNEARQETGDEPLEDEQIGNLLVPLATNPQYVAQVKGLGMGSPPDEDAMEGVGNIPESSSPESATNREARRNERGDEVNTEKAVALAQREEWKTYRKVCLRSMKRYGRNPSKVDFDTDILPKDDLDIIKGKLEEAETEDEVREIFSPYIED